MKFGVMLPHYRQVASAEGIIRVAQEAESMGFDSVWVSEHTAVPDQDVERFGLGYFDPFTVLGYAAAVTKQITLGTSIIIMPFRNPLHMAQVAATVDQLSNGRLILGVGVGSAEQEYRALGAPWEERGSVADEVIQVLQHVWTTDQPNFEGKHFNFSGINSFPQPVQRPHPPFWIGGGSRRSIRRAAEYGDAWHPSRPSFELLEEGAPRLHRLAERAGRDPSKILIAARHPMKILDGAAHSDWPLVGTESSVIEGINRFASAGVTHLVMDTFYSIPELHEETVDTVLATMERFARKNIPQYPET